jgi:hypothetical protein
MSTALVAMLASVGVHAQSGSALDSVTQSGVLAADNYLERSATTILSG